MSKSLRELLNCVKYVPFIVSYGQASSLHSIVNVLNGEFLESIYGFTPLLVEAGGGEQYLLGSLYIVDREGYRFIKHYAVEESRGYAVEPLPEVFLVKEKELGKYLKQLGLKHLSSRRDKLEKLGVECWGRRKITCILSTGYELRYGLTYLYLAVKCREYSIEITALELFDKTVYVMRKPVVDLIDLLVRKKKIDRSSGEKLVDILDRNILKAVSALIVKRRLILPNVKDTNDLINYARSHFKW